MELVETIQNATPTYVNVFIAIFRYLAPIIAVILLARVLLPLISFRREPEIWAWLCFSDGTKKAITHWENVIGRSKRSDVVIDKETVAKSQAVLTRYDDGSWSLANIGPADAVRVNQKKITTKEIFEKDTIVIGGVEMNLQPISHRQEVRLAQLRTRASSFGAGVINLILLTVFQFLCCIGFLMTGDNGYGSQYLIGFGGIAAAQWLLFLFYVLIRRVAFEVETVAFFLCTMGMAAICTVVPGEAVKQLVAMVLGIAIFLTLGWYLRNLDRAKRIRSIAAVAGIVFLVATLIFGTELNGAKNWIIIAGFSMQPSELSKICFVLVGASAMEHILTRKNLLLFIAYSVVVCGCLALMRDFGTALIFFMAFLVIAFMRSGSVGTVTLACSSLAFAGVVALRIAPHAMSRFANWRHIWEIPLDGGYQQTRALMCMASGGLWGLGVGRGWMRNLFASESDIVIATICEEWGIIMTVLLIFSITALAFFSVRCAKMGRSSFYTIGSCTAAAIFLVQAILNALGTVDVLPLTGVTFPFVSNGGSSMLCSWGLLAFIKAADTRQNASFAVRLLKRERGEADE